MDLIGVLALMYFFLPAYFANIAPVLCRKVCRPLAVPIDGGKRLFGKPIFGDNKTWRGLLAAVIIGTGTFIVQTWLYKNGYAQSLAIFDYTTMPIFLGAVLGFGAILGDLTKSFLKRRIGIKSGSPWYVVDQIDYVIGGILLCAPFFFPGWVEFFTLIVVSIALTIGANHLGYLLKFRTVKW